MVNGPARACDNCGHYAPERLMLQVDVSRPTEYYPHFHYICGDCQRRYATIEGEDDA